MEENKTNPLGTEPVSRLFAAVRSSQCHRHAGRRPV